LGSTRSTSPTLDGTADSLTLQRAIFIGSIIGWFDSYKVEMTKIARTLVSLFNGFWEGLAQPP